MKPELIPLKRTISILRQLDPNMPMSVVSALLAVAEGDDEGVEIVDLQTRSGLTRSSLNRALTYLGEEHWGRSKSGLQLVAQRVHPEDRRKRIAYLTSKGRLVVENMASALT